MFSASWEAMGTRWSIMVDTTDNLQSLLAHIQSQSSLFEQRFSRFIDGSEAVAFRSAREGTYPISDEFAQLLRLSDQVRHATNGAFDPAIGSLMEFVGYDPQYSFKQSDDLQNFFLPAWSLQGTNLTIESPIVFDIGGIGKGYWIDQIAKIIKEAGHSSYLVDGGGDMVATTKNDGEGWQIALEYPGDATRAIGTVELKNQGLAVSDVFKRRWGKWHHLISATQHQPTSTVQWVAVIADDATRADMGTSVISFSPIRAGTYFLIDENGKVQKSQDWNGEIF